MPTDAADIYGTVFKHGSATLLARIVDDAGQLLKADDLRDATYTVCLLDVYDANVRTPVAGHADVTLPPISVLHDALQTGPRWTRDAMGFNFQHTLDVSAAPAFAIAGRHYLVEYRFLPQAGPPIVVRFRVYVI